MTIFDSSPSISSSYRFYRSVHRKKGAFWLRTLLRQKRMERRRRRAEADELMVPPVLIYSVTGRCNLQCKGCYAGSRKGAEHNELPTERVKDLFNEASELGIGVIMIAGGKPCPFAPYSDLNIKDMSLKKALQSPFLNTISQSHHLLGEAKGGCTLWENREWVQNQLVMTLARPA